MPKSSKKESLKKELEEIKQKEKVIIKELDKELNKDKTVEKERRILVKHFTFSDFCQSAIGVGVFGLSTIMNPDIWGFIEKLDLSLIFWVHLFFIVCFVIALNYEFRADFSLDTFFIRNLLKRVFFMYISVAITVTLLLVLVKKITMDISNSDFLENFLIGQSVGLMGAVTFAFFKK